MLIGVPKEPRVGESLVAATPDTVGKLIKLGYTVCVEKDAGSAASYPDELYRDAGAQIVTKEQAWGADIVTCLETPSDMELALIKSGATLISRLDPGAKASDIDVFSEMGITALAMDAVPRISRAQSLDVRSSMANVAGYRAVVEAANVFGRLFTGQVTAAGKVPPATVYVIGAGVAGLAAIGTANSLGAVVKATDVRPEVGEQVKSMGGDFVEIPVKQESADGYARAMTAEQEALALKVYTEQAAKADIVITTAQIPGKAAPLLITAEAVAAMKPGSVIVDMGAATGGNCELTRPGEVHRTDNGVTIIGYTDLSGRLPGQASQLFGQNVVNFFKLTTPEKNGVLTLDMDDEIVRGVTVTLDGQAMWPPPPVKVSAAPAAPEPQPEQAPAAEETPAGRNWKSLLWKVAAVGVFAWLILSAPADMQSHFIVFALAVVVGFYVITNVTHSLHTPLMSVTNAISGIIVVGAVLQLGVDNVWIQVLAMIATVVASINIFGGFTVTHRMLNMFQRS
ncbi:MAG: Re/Si-specific NAD(P)(+) transhydrogenase subunit alpha [Actinomycetaceae bacterium]|nr:Re/Si-specific NAD(P)(+) transhydrogenase subunit alpha [Actinomycetaceae bacterium]